MGQDNTPLDAGKSSSEAVKKNIFKENWLKIDKTCSQCGQVTEKQKGLTKQNVKKLFTIKFDMNEIIMTLIIILVLISAYAYKVDTQICRDYVKEAEAQFIPTTNAPNYTYPAFNFTTTNITTINDNPK
jgi:hypothetical protein